VCQSAPDHSPFSVSDILKKKKKKKKLYFRLIQFQRAGRYLKLAYDISSHKKYHDITKYRDIMVWDHVTIQI